MQKGQQIWFKVVASVIAHYAVEAQAQQTQAKQTKYAAIIVPLNIAIETCKVGLWQQVGKKNIYYHYLIWTLH